MYQNLFDSHTHSENSLDGHHSVTFMVESAVEKEIQGLAVTDHCDCDGLAEYSYARRLQMTALDVAMAREAFRGKLILTGGIELGHPHYDYAGAEALLESQHFDFVLLALHRIRGWEDFCKLDYSKMSLGELGDMMLQYFDELLELIEWGKFDALAHLNYPLRYPLMNHGIDLPLAAYADQVDEVLKALVRGGKALELNTSGLRTGMRDTLPPVWVAQRFRELGGEKITIGSDAHSAGDVGAGIRDAMHLLLENGYEHFAFYRDRKPVMLRII